MVHIVVVCLGFFPLPMEVFAAHFPPNMLQRAAARPELRTTAAIPLTTPSHSNLDTSSSETTKLAPFPLDLGRRQQTEPTVQPIPGASYLGCWVDNSSRIVGAILTLANDLTPASCRDYCSSRSYSVFGVEGAAVCFCDSTLSNWAVRTAEADCSWACDGNAAVVCGGSWRINVYSQTPLSSSTSSSSVTPSSISVTSTLPQLNSPSVPNSAIQPPSSFSNVTAMGMPPGEIAGIAIGAAFGGAVVAILVIYLLFVVPRKRNEQPTTVYNQQLKHPPEVQELQAN